MDKSKSDKKKKAKPKRNASKGHQTEIQQWAAYQKLTEAYYRVRFQDFFLTYYIPSSKVLKRRQEGVVKSTGSPLSVKKERFQAQGISFQQENTWKVPFQ